MKKTPTFIAVLMVAAAAGLWAQAASAQSATPQTAADLIRAGDELYAKFDDAGAMVQ